MNELVSNDEIKVCIFVTYSELQIQMNPIPHLELNPFSSFYFLEQSFPDLSIEIPCLIIDMNN